MKLLLAGGGTGGHIYPALAIAEAAQSVTPPHEVEFAGDPSGLERDLIARAGYPFHAAPGNPLPRKWGVASALALGRIMLRVPLCVRLLRKVQPDVVIGTGGYVCATIVYAASWLRVPIILLELNAIPGRTTRWLARRVSRIAVSFDQARPYLPTEKVVHTGAPVRQAIRTANRSQARQQLEIGENDRLLLIFGGSQAAHWINLAVVEAVGQLLMQMPDLHIVHLCGERDRKSSESARECLPIPHRTRYRPLAYCHTMETLLAAADLCLCRAGGSSIGELTARGIPAILVPYPYATDNHQEANARVVEAAGAATVVLDSELDGASLVREVGNLLQDADRLSRMREASLQFGRLDAASRVVALAESLQR